MDTWEVVGHLSYGYSWEGKGLCPLCGDDGEDPPLPCQTHGDCIHLCEIVEASSEDQAREMAEGSFVLRKAADGWDVEPDMWRSLAVTNLSQVARDRAALTAWTMGLPIPGGPPVEWGHADA